jgi:hypothetical protein
MKDQDQSETYIDWHYLEPSELHLPEPSEWSCNVYGVNYSPMKGDHPNWFCRQMCFLLLGVRWVKNKEI